MKNLSPISRAFTLLEMLCATAVVSIVLVVTVQLVGSAGEWSGAARRLLSSSAEVRSTLDRMTSDLSARVAVPRANVAVLKAANGNDALQMLSDVRNRSTTARQSAVTYAVAEPAGGDLQLQRIVVPVEWADEPQNLLGTLPAGAAVDSFSEDCFRMEIAFLLANGEIRADPPADRGEISAIIVTVAVLDTNTRARYGAAQVRALATSLPDAEDGRTPLETWSGAMPGGSIGREIRFGQRFFPLSERIAF